VVKKLFKFRESLRRKNGTTDLHILAVLWVWTNTQKNYSDKNGHKFNSAIDIESKNVKLFQLLIFCWFINCYHQ
jgi:hypothetical protein